MKRSYKEAIVSAFPAIVFYVVYKFFSYQYALIIGILIGIFVYGHKYKKFKKISTLDKIGLFGLIIQTIIGLIAKNPKIYFLYPLIENIIFALIFFLSLMMKTDAISFIARDFTDSEDIMNLLRPAYRKLTLLWGLYYVLRIVIKILGLLKLSFEQLYIINWIFGMPVSAFLVIYTFSYPNKYYKQLEISKNMKSEKLS